MVQQVVDGWVLMVAGDMDGWSVDRVFQAEWAEVGAGSQGWAKPYFPSWEAERIACTMPDRFRFNLAKAGPEGEPGVWEALTGGEEWVECPFIDDHGVGKWNMDPTAEWRILSAMDILKLDLSTPEMEERLADFTYMQSAVERAIENHCNLIWTDTPYLTGEF